VLRRAVQQLRPPVGARLGGSRLPPDLTWPRWLHPALLLAAMRQVHRLAPLASAASRLHPSAPSSPPWPLPPADHL
jgi:hypothetical protein